MIQKNKYLILELIIIFISIFLYHVMNSRMDYDEIWNYGFSYNIASGLIPYKDFNMITTPLYSMLGAVFLYSFGKNIVIYYLFNSIITTIIYYYIKKQSPNNYRIIFPILIIVSMANYNLLCLLFLLILISLETKKSNDYLIGLILGLTFITKQNIGIYLCIPTLFTKDIKKIIKRIIGFIIPIALLFIYLILNNCVYEFIDYTFLGLKSFTKENIYTYPSFTILSILTLIYLIYKYIKTKDIVLIYIICFQGMSFPIFNPYHVLLSFIPALMYLVNDVKINFKVSNYCFVVCMIILLSVNIYQTINNKWTYPNNTINFKYKRLNDNIVNFINGTKEYITNIEGNIYILDEIAYLIKLESFIPINKYDLLNNGNMGAGGLTKILKEIDNTCKKEKCTILLDENKLDDNKYNQYDNKLYYYVIDNYQEKGVIRGLKIYTNY